METALWFLVGLVGLVGFIVSERLNAIHTELREKLDDIKRILSER